MATDPNLDADRYQAWYTEKLWTLLPAVYRAEDPHGDGSRGPLRELVERIGAQAAVVRRSIDRLWEDQSIESCDDWVIEYIGDLVSTNLVSSLDSPGRRVDVFKTIYYRRRKGTVAMLEELAARTTRWRVRVVEFFRRLARTRHNLDPAIGWPVTEDNDDPRFRLQRAQQLRGPLTKTPTGGVADLRHAHGASLAASAFDEFSYTADVRRGNGRSGWYGIPRLGVFVWRLHSTGAAEIPPLKDEHGDDRYSWQVTAVQDSACKNQYTFDPTGRDIPLFARRVPTPDTDDWVPPLPHQVPGPISFELLDAARDELYGVDGSLAIFKQSGPLYDLIPASDVAKNKPMIDPVRGRMIFEAPQGDARYRVHYHYGFPADIGAGFYDRRPFSAPEPPAAVTAEVFDGGNALDAALTSPSARIEIKDSLTYTKASDLADIELLELIADNGRRPLVRLPDATKPWRLTGKKATRLLIDGLFVSGGDLVLRGSFDCVVLRCCTLDPGTWDSEHNTWQQSADARALSPVHLRVEGTVDQLRIERCVTGPIVEQGDGHIDALEISDSIVQAADPRPSGRALVARMGETKLSRSTVLGRADLRRLHASECILHDTVIVDDYQHGCVRFSAWAKTGQVPRPYESHAIEPGADLFVSTGFGDPGFAQLSASTSDVITTGGEDGTEMGAFSRERNPIRERSLLIKYQEYLPVGLEPVIIFAT